MVRSLAVSCLAFLALAFSPAAAQATLIGDEVFCVADATTAADCDNSAVVGGGVEFEITQGDPETITVDFSGDSVSFFVVEDIDLNGGTVTFSDLNWVDNPAGELVGITNFVGSFGNGAVVSAANIATAANAFTITFPSGVILIESTFAFDLVTTDAVPLPPGIALLLAGIAGIALMRRRAV
ncbi:MAG: VPLPA-CTERM sorting domain-containing protein [Pseudomonadota bacterium]